MHLHTHGTACHLRTHTPSKHIPFSTDSTHQYHDVFLLLSIYYTNDKDSYYYSYCLTPLTCHQSSSILYPKPLMDIHTFLYTIVESLRFYFTCTISCYIQFPTTHISIQHYIHPIQISLTTLPSTFNMYLFVIQHDFSWDITRNYILLIILLSHPSRSRRLPSTISILSTT